MKAQKNAPNALPESRGKFASGRRLSVLNVDFRR